MEASWPRAPESCTAFRPFLFRHRATRVDGMQHTVSGVTTRDVFTDPKNASGRPCFSITGKHVGSWWRKSPMMVAARAKTLLPRSLPCLKTASRHFGRPSVSPSKISLLWVHSLPL